MSLASGSFPMLVDGGFDWVDVRDVAEAAVAAAERAPAGSRYIVGGRWASMAELAQLVPASVTGARPPGAHVPLRDCAMAWAPVSTAFSPADGQDAACSPPTPSASCRANTEREPRAGSA